MGKKRKKKGGKKAVATPVIDTPVIEAAEEPAVLPEPDLARDPIIEWEIAGLTDINGGRLSPKALRKTPPTFTVISGGKPVVTMLLTPGSTARIQAGLAEAQHALAGTNPEPPKTLASWFMSLIDWCLAHKIRGGLLALFTLFSVYSVLAGAITLA